MSEAGFFDVMARLLDELLEGPSADASVLNSGDSGLLASLDKLSADEASLLPSSGGASIAAHVDHLRYGFQLLNRWSNGERPFEETDYQASWTRISVSNEEWVALRAAMRSEAWAWRRAIGCQRELSNFELTTLLSSIVHLAYHMGAMRQINRSLRGPEARD